MKIKNKTIVVILILISILLCFNLYINHNKKVIKINKKLKKILIKK